MKKKKKLHQGDLVAPQATFNCDHEEYKKRNATIKKEGFRISKESCIGDKNIF